MPNTIELALLRDLLTLPKEIVALPVVTRPQVLPFDQLSWQNFERLVYRWLYKDSNVKHCARYGRPGQNQQGIDIFARMRGGDYACWQVRNRACVTPSSITKVVNDFLEGEWAEKTTRFVLCVQTSLADVNIQDLIEKEVKRLQKQSIVFDVVNGIQLSEELRSHPELIDQFFGRPWVTTLVGEEAAMHLKGRLETLSLVELHQRLGEIYEAKFRQLDPGLKTEDMNYDVRDIRKRFVVPDVDPVNPFSEPSLHLKDNPKDTFERDVVDWSVDDNDDFAIHKEQFNLASEPTVKPSLSLDDWLQRGERAVLITGAPGSGKSTVLRCLALDLVRSPELFPQIHQRSGPLIPLLIPFSIWSRLTAKEQQEVGLAEVIRATFGAYFRARELTDSFIEALYDDRLLLLIDGIDEYVDEQSARTTFTTIETFARTNNVFTIATTRPAGLQRLGVDNGFWSKARLIDLSRPQQREMAIKLFGEEKDESLVIGQVDRFFLQLEHNGRLQSLAGNPLLLYGLLSVSVHLVILPSTRFELFEKLIEILLRVHPARRATAAAEVRSNRGIFSTDDVRREALSKLAFETQQRGTDAGIDRKEARGIIQDYLVDQDAGPAWSQENARIGARELVDCNADTSGLLIECGPDELMFCHAAFREHLAGLELCTWDLEAQTKFVFHEADDPRWRGPILVLLQSLDRRTDLEQILKALQGEDNGSSMSTNRRLLLAEGAFATASFSGAVGRQAALNNMDRIETGVDEAEKLELLSLALDGPRVGPVGEAIVDRIGKMVARSHKVETRNLHSARCVETLR